MEAGEENGSNVTLKRQREPFSDTEDNIIPATDVKDGLKRRRLEPTGLENRSPESSSSGRLAELQAKPDTPAIPSVRSQVQLLTQRKDGGAFVAQRCLSDPGTEGPSVPSKGVRERLLGEEEFHHRLERFEAPSSQASISQTPSPVGSCPRPRSDFVSGIQQKLQCTTTPSSKQASIIRQERELELNQLSFQPISENAWLKRSSSDSSLTQGRPVAGSRSPSSRVPVSKRKFCWPPMQPLDVPGDAENDDGSFTELMTSVSKTSDNLTGEEVSRDAPAASTKLKLAIKEPIKSISHSEENGNEKVITTKTPNKEEQPVSQDPETQTVLKLSFSEESSLSELHAADKHSFLQSTLLDESNTKETSQVSRVTEEERSEVFTFDDDETVEGSTYGEEEIEPSTDEECRVWRYPEGLVSSDEASSEKKQVFVKGIKEEMKSGRETKEKESRVRNKSEPTDVEGAPVQGENVRPEEEKCEREEGVDDCLDEKFALKVEILRDKSSGNDRERKSENVALLDVKDEAQCSSDYNKEENDSAGGREDVDELPARSHKAESSKKVTFILEPELINSSALSEGDVSVESRVDTSLSDAGSGSHDDTNSAETIEKMFEEVLEYAEKVEEEGHVGEDGEDHDSGIAACSGSKDGVDLESEKTERGEEPKQEECGESDGDELLTFPQSGILSPLSKSVEAVVTPMRLAAALESNPPSLLLTPEEGNNPPTESAPLYSIDAYRTQRQSKPPTFQSVTPGVQRPTQETPKPVAFNTRERITALTEEAGKLQTVISQTLQALSCCIDEGHGRGSLEEAEAEKLLLVSCEKRSALLAEVARLREERNLQHEKAPKEDVHHISQQACRGTISITKIQLPLKVEFVCSSHSRAGRPSHYFFVLIRYGPCNIIATPLATAADAQNGDTISFPTSVTLKDIRSTFEIDIEVYSLCPTSATTCSTDRTSTKSRVTPRKLLNTITKSSNAYTCTASAALNTRRTSNFTLVGSHKITLASLGCSKFPLDKMKLDGKIRRLLGDEFQEKVPFLSPLEGHIYLKLESEGHSNVQHHGFLTMFELISGFGVWNRRYFVLEECNMYYWNNPNNRETKVAEGSISLSTPPSRCVRPVKRDSCARPFTFELVNASRQEDQNQEALSKCWFSADTKEERLDWMEKLNQALLDYQTWNCPPVEASNTSSSASLRESIL